VRREFELQGGGNTPVLSIFVAQVPCSSPGAKTVAPPEDKVQQKVLKKTWLDNTI
jgi:hypothetical protein